MRNYIFSQYRLSIFGRIVLSLTHSLSFLYKPLSLVSVCRRNISTGRWMSGKASDWAYSGWAPCCCYKGWRYV